jgi:hypothetical protein
MRITAVSITAIAFSLTVVGCTPAAPGPQPGPASSSSPSISAPPGIDLDSAAAKPLLVGPDGGHVLLSSGDWTVVVSVPRGAVPAGTNWTVAPLRTAPSGIPDALAPGIYVDEAGQAPAVDCMVAFATLGAAHPDATIVKLSEDGLSSQVVASQRQDTKAGTVLVAEVSGFSGYGVGKAPAAARKTASDQRKKKGGAPYAISVHDTVKFNVEDWKFQFTLDMNLAGGSGDGTGTYTGNTTLAFSGNYAKDLAGVIKGLGKVSGSAKGSANAFLFDSTDPLMPLLDDFPYQMDDPSGYGSVTVASSGGLSMLAKAPAGTVTVPTIKAKKNLIVPFRIKVDGTKVTVEISKIGEFSGDLVKL